MKPRMIGASVPCVGRPRSAIDARTTKKAKPFGSAFRESMRSVAVVAFIHKRFVIAILFIWDYAVLVANQD